jgi:hypothetical protein
MKYDVVVTAAAKVSRRAFGRLMSGAPRRKGNAKTTQSIAIARLNREQDVGDAEHCYTQRVPGQQWHSAAKEALNTHKQLL